MRTNLGGLLTMNVKSTERNGNETTIVVEIDKELMQQNIPILSMSLQIPVENALKHAFPQPKDTDVIHISVMKRDNDLLLSVTDNGQGYHPESVTPTGRDTGTGLQLIMRTILILNEYNHREASFQITNQPEPLQGTRVELVMPIDYQFSSLS